MENYNRTITIGKAPGVDHVVNDPTVSRNHARIVIRQDGSVWIEDAGSTNGTFVNGVRISGARQLMAGDSVALGNARVDWQSVVSRSGTKVVAGMAGVIPGDAVRTIKVGRAAGNDKCVADNRVSSHHCTLVVHGDGSVSLVDNSTNGTYVNGRRVPGSFRLTKGDSVLLANAVPLDWESLVRPPVQQPPVISDRRPPVDIVGSGPISGPTPRKSSLWVWIVSAVVALAAIGIGVYMFVNREQRMTPSDIYAKYDNSVVIIAHVGIYEVLYQGRPIGDYHPLLAECNMLSIDEDGDISSEPKVWTGTGFYVSDDGKIMTNHHVVNPAGDDNAKYDSEKIAGQVKEFLRRVTEQTGDTRFRQLADGIEVKFKTVWLGVIPNGRKFDPSDTGDYTKCEVLARSDNDKVDLGLIQTYDKTVPDKAVIVDVLDYSKPEHRRIGDKIFTIGFPTGMLVGNTDAGLQANHQGGEVTQERGSFEYGHNIKVTGGASGSPVFDEYGRFAGVIYAVYGDGSNGYNLAVMPEQAAKFYKRNVE